MTPGSIGTSPSDIGPVGELAEKRASDLTGVHIYKSGKIQVIKQSDVKRLCWARQAEIYLRYINE